MLENNVYNMVIALFSKYSSYYVMPSKTHLKYIQMYHVYIFNNTRFLTGGVNLYIITRWTHHVHLNTITQYIYIVCLYCNTTIRVCGKSDLQGNSNRVLLHKTLWSVSQPGITDGIVTTTFKCVELACVILLYKIQCS